MRDGRLHKKKWQHPQRNPKVQMRVIFVTLVLKFQSVISVDRTSTFRPKIYFKRSLKVELTKFAHQVLKIHLGVEVDSQEGRTFRVCEKCALDIRNASSLFEFFADFLLSSVSLASRDQDGCPSNSTIDVYDLTDKWQK